MTQLKSFHRLRALSSKNNIALRVWIWEWLRPELSRNLVPSTITGCFSKNYRKRKQVKFRRRRRFQWWVQIQHKNITAAKSCINITRSSYNLIRMRVINLRRSACQLWSSRIAITPQWGIFNSLKIHLQRKLPSQIAQTWTKLTQVYAVWLLTISVVAKNAILTPLEWVESETTSNLQAAWWQLENQCNSSIRRYCCRIKTLRKQKIWRIKAWVESPMSLLAAWCPRLVATTLMVDTSFATGANIGKSQPPKWEKTSKQIKF